MKKIELLIFLLILPNFFIAQGLDMKFQSQLDSLFKIHYDAVGVLLHIESPENELSWTSAIGYSDMKAKKGLKKHQPVLIASNTKPYVAAAILRLVELKKITLNSPIQNLLKRKICRKLKKAGYEVNKITLTHLLSHTSGITDYVNDDYFEFVNQNQQYQWKKNEQIQRSLDIGGPEFSPGTDFKYGDINYLLLTDIIEKQTNKPFYLAIKELLKFEELNLTQTWFKDLDAYPENALPLAHQYADKFQWDSYNINPSWDLYGGGGIATTSKEAALFMQYLFEGKIIEDSALLSKMYSFVLPKEKSNYCLGIRHFNFPEFSAYYHGGWWGTDVAYCPETNSTIAIFTLQKSKRGEFAKLSIEMLNLLKAHQKKKNSGM